MYCTTTTSGELYRIMNLSSADGQTGDIIGYNILHSSSFFSITNSSGGGSVQIIYMKVVIPHYKYSLGLQRLVD